MIEKLTGLVAGANPYLWGGLFLVGLAVGGLASRWVMAPLVERAQAKAAACEADAVAIEARTKAAQARAKSAIAKAKVDAARTAKQVADLQRQLGAREYRDAPADQVLDEIYRQWKNSQPPR